MRKFIRIILFVVALSLVILTVLERCGKFGTRPDRQSAFQPSDEISREPEKLPGNFEIENFIINTFGIDTLDTGQ